MGNNHMEILKISSEAELLKRLVWKRSKIICVGAMGNPMFDPSPLFLSNLVRSGNVTIIDAQEQHPYLGRIRKKLREAIRKTGSIIAKKRLSILNEPHHWKKGWGGLLAYRHRSRGRGKNIKLIPANAWDTGLKHETYDLIVDRGTYPFLHQNGPTRLRESVRHYLQLIKRGGKIVFFTPNEDLEKSYAAAPTSKLLDELELSRKAGNVKLEGHIMSSKGYNFPSDIANHLYTKAIVVTRLK